MGDEMIRSLERRARSGEPEAMDAWKEALARQAGEPSAQSTVKRLPFEARSALRRAVLQDHRCSNSTCDIWAAMEHGFEEVGCWNLMRATDSYRNTRRLLKVQNLDIWGTDPAGDRYAFPRDYEAWMVWLGENACQCPSCGALNFPSIDEWPEACGDCDELLSHPER